MRGAAEFAFAAAIFASVRPAARKLFFHRMDESYVQSREGAGGVGR
jgi:hypothetical protein